MSAQHRLDLDQPGTFAFARVVCLGGPDDICQQWCAEGCEEECYGEDVVYPPVELIVMAPVAGHRWEPMDPPSCRVADWINNCGIADTYAGDEAVLAWDDETDSQPKIRSGLIAEEWTGDDYVWDYAEEAPA